MKRFHARTEPIEKFLEVGNRFGERLDSLPRATHSNRRPVFIVGMPRSGTSLVEQILASHPAVYGAGELNQLRRLVGSASNPDWAEGDPYPQSLDWLSARWADRLAAQYLGFIDTLDRRATYNACARSWKRRPDVGANPDFPDLTLRDAAAVRARA